MNIPLTLDTEHQAALDAMLTRYNEFADTSLTETEYLALILNNAIGAEVQARFNAEVARIGNAASVLSYEDRQDLIAQIEAQLP